MKVDVLMTINVWKQLTNYKVRIYIVDYLCRDLYEICMYYHREKMYTIM